MAVRIVLTLFTVLLALIAGLFLLWRSNIISLPFANLGQSSGSVAGDNNLFNLVKTGDLDSVLKAVEAGADVNAQDEYGQTPLMYAAGSSPTADTLSALIKAGADPNMQTSTGWTALMYAARDNKNLDVVLSLMNAATDPTLKNSDGQSAADLARSNVAMSTAIFERLQDLAAKPFNRAWPSGYTVPVEGATISSRAALLPGAPRAYRNGTHEGFDFYSGSVSVVIEYGTPVRSVAPGTVVRSDQSYIEMTPEEYDQVIETSKRSLNTPAELLDKLRGRQVWVEHAGGYISRYAHLSSIPATLVIGSKIKQGDVVGETGNSGTLEGVQNTKDEPHPHVEIWKGDEYLGHGLETAKIYELAEQVFGVKALPPYVEQQ
jgi:murein DD-endopeptidase MepM/ murein hydrolase activator NlpD